MVNLREVMHTIFNSVLVYLLLLILARIIGKKLIGQLTFFDFVTGITIGTIGGAFVTTELRSYYVLLSAVVFAVLVFITGRLTLRNVTFRKIVEGEPIVVVQNGKIYEENMRKVRYNVDDLMMQLREKDVFDVGEVEFAVIEPHGQLSVLKKTQYQPPTAKDLNLNTQYKGLSTEIIRDGAIQEENLKQNHLSYEWLYKELARRNVRDVHDVVYATLSTAGDLYIDLRNDAQAYMQRIEDDDSLI